MKLLFKKPHTLYTSIDYLPIFNWHKLNTEGDIKWLIKEEHSKYPKNTEHVLNDILEDYYQRFGKTELLETLQNKRKLTILICENTLQPDAVKDILITKLERKMAEKQNQMNTTFEEQMAIISEHMGFRLDAKAVSVAEYQGIINSISKKSLHNK